MKLLLSSILVSFIAALIMGKLMIPLFNRLQFAQPINAEAPQQHKKKSGTPTLGGFIFIFAVLLVFSITTNSFNHETIFLLLSLILFSLIGFIDDTLKLSRKNNAGVSSRQKMLLLITVSLFLTYFIYHYLPVGSSIIVPFQNKLLDLNILHIPFIIFFYTALTNSVNLTDGLDGLAASVTIIVLIFFATISFYLGHSNLALFCGIVAGSLLGFLRYNAYPASIIMGDTGSIALGGIVASIAILLKLELIILLVGGVYLLEAFSSLAQISWYKLTKKRIFKMAPIHHSFELSGVNESRIVSMFLISTVVLCIFAFLSLL